MDDIRVTVRLFASLREAVGEPMVKLHLSSGATADEAWRTLSDCYPAIRPRRASLSAAVNRQYSTFDAVLCDGDEIVFIPPVSGG